MTTEPFIRMFSGRVIYLRDPALNAEIHLEDIAYGLARIARYTGQTRHRYSVASHSLMVADLVPSRLHASGLMHDAIEAILGDVSSPLKALLPDYLEIEARWEAAMADRWGLALGGPEVHAADVLAYEIECRDLTTRMVSEHDLSPALPRCTAYAGSPERISAWWFSEALLCGVPGVA